MPYIQTNLKLTISQYHYLRELTAGMDSDSRRLFIHTFLCQRQMRAKSDYHAWKGVPLPRKSFIHVYCRNYSWESVEPFMTRAPYYAKEGICFRYRIHEHIIDTFIEKGEDLLLSPSRLQDQWFVDVDGRPLPKLNRPLSSAPPTQVDLGYGIAWLIRQRDRIERTRDSLSDAELASKRARYLHNLNCYQGILERVTSIDYTKRQAEYSQELTQPHEGLRVYEKGGGLQGASRNFREVLLISSPVINYDVVKCHATIAHHEMEKLGISSHLDEVLSGRVSSPDPLLSVGTVKTAVLAVINGARLVKRLSSRFAIPRLVIEEPLLADKDVSTKARALASLVGYLKGIATSIAKWSKLIPKNEKIAAMSALLQRIEVDSLRDIHDLASNNQHDGALIHNSINIGEVTTGYLDIQPKPISSPDPEESVIVCGRPIEIIPFNAGCANIADIIMGAGTRLHATTGYGDWAPTPHKNTISRSDNSADTSNLSAGDSQ